MFADYGTFCHLLMERWEKGEIPAIALAEEYEAGYDNALTHAFPPFPATMPEKFYLAGLNYFEKFDGFDEDYEILEVEEKFQIEIGGYPFVGICDVVCRNRKTGKIEVIDHKTKSRSSMKKELDLYRKQLYTYAIYIKEKYGEYPARLRFNMLKEGYWINEDFDPAYVEETKQWIIDTIEKIKAETEWKVQPNWYFCRNICDQFGNCTARDSILNSYLRTKNGKEKEGDE